MPSNVKEPDVRTRSGFLTQECPHSSTLRRGVHIVASLVIQIVVAGVSLEEMLTTRKKTYFSGSRDFA